MKLILECCDCFENFCATCDAGHTHCPDCKGPMCEDCSAFSLDSRQCRCAQCADPGVGTVAFPYTAADRKLYKTYTSLVKGCLDSD